MKPPRVPHPKQSRRPPDPRIPHQISHLRGVTRVSGFRSSANSGRQPANAICTRCGTSKQEFDYPSRERVQSEIDVHLRHGEGEGLDVHGIAPLFGVPHGYKGGNALNIRTAFWGAEAHTYVETAIGRGSSPRNCRAGLPRNMNTLWNRSGIALEFAARKPDPNLGPLQWPPSPPPLPFGRFCRHCSSGRRCPQRYCKADRTSR